MARGKREDLTPLLPNASQRSAVALVQNPENGLNFTPNGPSTSPSEPQDARFLPLRPSLSVPSGHLRVPSDVLSGIQSPIYKEGRLGPLHCARIGLVQQTFIRRARQPPRERQDRGLRTTDKRLVVRGQVAQNEMLTNITLEKNTKPSLCLFAFLIAAIFLLASCSESESYMDAYNGCRTLPGHDSVKFTLCPRLAELMEREQELKERLERIKNEQENIIIAISYSNQELP